MQPRLVLGLVCVATFLVYLDTSITPVALPAIRADVGGGASAGQWLLDAYTLAFACLLLTAGSLGDRVGRKPVLLLGIAGFTAASVVAALAPDMAVLIAGRAAQGVFAAAAVPLSLAAITELHPDPAARARAIGVWGGAAGVALALGPLLGGVLVEFAGWRSMFWLNVPLGVLALVGLALRMPGAPAPGGRRADWLGQVLFVLGASAVTFALIEGEAVAWVGLLALLAFGWWENRVAAPMLPPALLRIPAVAVACVVNFLGLFGLYGVLLLVTTHLQHVVGLSPLATGLRFLTLFGFLAVAAVGASAVVARLGTRRTMVVGLCCVAAGLAGLGLLDLGVGYWGYAWALVLLGIGVPLSSGVVAIQAMMGAVPAGSTGTASGAMNTFRQFGAVVGVAVAGILSPEGSAMAVTFLVAAACAAAAAVLTRVVLSPA
ncbi:MFS transporter [Actinosynnema sp. NPDC020468]|uniref:MFS transporter n=1 Tax=Actinosynnema sp. NPDC020468 TaxID=3154488 RepID=UPI0034065BA7